MRKPFRRVFFVAFLLLVPAVMACEAALDFDRSPLQPQFEAGPPDAGGSTSSDAAPDRAAPPGSSDGGDAGKTPPADAGSDARADAGDAA